MADHQGLQIWFEGIKAVAAVVQSSTIIVGAILTYRFAKALEGHKFDIRLQEVRFSKLYDKQMEAIEGTHAKLIAIIHAASNITSFFKNVTPREGKSVEENIELDLNEQVQCFFDATKELGEFFNQRSIYLPDGICKEIAELVRTLTATIRVHHFMSTFKTLPQMEQHNKWLEAEGKVKEAQLVRTSWKTSSEGSWTAVACQRGEFEPRSYGLQEFIIRAIWTKYKSACTLVKSRSALSIASNRRNRSLAIRQSSSLRIARLKCSIVSNEVWAIFPSSTSGRGCACHRSG